MKSVLELIKRNSRKMLVIVTLGAFLISCAPAASARCAMCKLAVSSAENAARIIYNLNLGILVLLVPPVLIFCSIFIIAFRHSKLFTRSEVESEASYEKLSEAALNVEP